MELILNSLKLFKFKNQKKFLHNCKITLSRWGLSSFKSDTNATFFLQICILIVWKMMNASIVSNDNYT